MAGRVGHKKANVLNLQIMKVPISLISRCVCIVCCECPFELIPDKYPRPNPLHQRVDSRPQERLDPDYRLSQEGSPVTLSYLLRPLLIRLIRSLPPPFPTHLPDAQPNRPIPKKKYLRLKYADPYMKQRETDWQQRWNEAKVTDCFTFVSLCSHLF